MVAQEDPDLTTSPGQNKTQLTCRIIPSENALKTERTEPPQGETKRNESGRDPLSPEMEKKRHHTQQSTDGKELQKHGTSA